MRRERKHLPKGSSKCPSQSPPQAFVWIHRTDRRCFYEKVNGSRRGSEIKHGGVFLRGARGRPLFLRRRIVICTYCPASPNQEQENGHERLVSCHDVSLCIVGANPNRASDMPDWILRTRDENGRRKCFLLVVSPPTGWT
jgi:hypothetical protein